jgi:hypothetical protein
MFGSNLSPTLRAINEMSEGRSKEKQYLPPALPVFQHRFAGLKSKSMCGFSHAVSMIQGRSYLTISGQRIR